MEDNLYSSGHFQDIVPKDEGIDIIQYLQHGFVRRTNIQTQFPTLSLSRHIPLTNMPLPIVDRASFNNVDSSILAGQSGVRQRILSEIPGSSPVHNSTKRAREEDTEDLNPSKRTMTDSSAGSTLLDSNTTIAKGYTCHLCQFRLTRRSKRKKRCNCRRLLHISCFDGDGSSCK